MISAKAANFVFLLSFLLISRAAAQTPCFSNDDCVSGFQVCSVDCIDESCNSGICNHKTIFPLSFVEILGIVLLSLLILLANAAGIGGGALLLPVLSLLLRFHQNQAGAISNALVFVAATTRFIITFNQKHPRKNRTIIDYSIVAVMLPTGLLGTVVGVYMNLTLPEGVQVIILAVVFLYVAYATLRKGLKFYSAETRSIKEKSSLLEQNSNFLKSQLLPLSSISTPAQDQQREQSNQELEDIYKSERTHLPVKKLIYVWIVFVALVLTSIIPGPQNAPIIDVEKCGAVQWLMKVLLVIVCAICTVMAGRHILTQQRRKERLGYEFDREDVRWSVNKFISLGICSLLCGALASSLGIGGGVLYNPLLLIIGVNPQVAAASGMYILFYNTFASVIQLIIVNKLHVMWSLFLGAFAVVFTVIGNNVINREIKKSGRQSIIVLILGGFILIAAVVTPIFSFLMASGSSYSLWDFGQIC